MSETIHHFRPRADDENPVLSTAVGAGWRPRAGADGPRDEGDLKRVEVLLLEMAMLKMQRDASPTSISYADVDVLRLGPKALKGVWDFLWNCYAELGWLSGMTTPEGVAGFRDRELEDLSRRGRIVLHLAPESGDAGVRSALGVGPTNAEYVAASRRLRAASIECGAVFVLGAGRGLGDGHVEASAALAESMRAAHVTWLAAGASGALISHGEALAELGAFVGGANLHGGLMSTDLTVDTAPFGGRLPAERAALLRRLDAARARHAGEALSVTPERLPRGD